MKTLLCLLLLIPGILTAEDEFHLPAGPLGQVLDRADWLGSERNQMLEGKLQRYRDEHGVDVLVVIWDREIPSDLSVHDLAKMIGAEWTRSELWAVILTQPNPIGRPEVRYGGAIADAINPRALDTIVSEIITRGLKDWTDQRRIETIALGIGREFIYLAQRREQELAVVREQAAVIMEERSQARTTSVAGAVGKAVGGLIALAGAGAACWFFLLRRPQSFEFPETRWRRRLGGEWSGGSTIMVKSSTSQAS